MLRKFQNQEDQENEPFYLILDEYARVFSGLRKGYPYFSENIDDAKPLQGQAKFDYLQRYSTVKLEQMFLEENKDVRKKRKYNKSRVSI